jgi:hypothetical protein
VLLRQTKSSSKPIPVAEEGRYGGGAGEGEGEGEGEGG